MWKPIETAPKDKHILVWTQWGIIEAYWDSLSKFWKEPAFLMNQTANLFDQPTHWMELPDAPEMEME